MHNFLAIILSKITPNTSYSLGELSQILNYSRPAIRRKIHELKIKTKQDKKEKRVQLADAQKIAKAFDINVNIFNEPFSEINESNNEPSVKFNETPRPNISSKQINKHQNHYNESFNERFNNELKEQVQELRREKEELKTDLKETRQELKMSHSKYQEMAEKATNYQEKYYEARRLLQAPQNTDSMEIAIKQKWWHLKVPLWVQWGSWIVLIVVSFILLFSNQILSFFASIH